MMLVVVVVVVVLRLLISWTESVEMTKNSSASLLGISLGEDITEEAEDDDASSSTLTDSDFDSLAACCCLRLFLCGNGFGCKYKRSKSLSPTCVM